MESGKKMKTEIGFSFLLDLDKVNDFFWFNITYNSRWAIQLIELNWEVLNDKEN